MLGPYGYTCCAIAKRETSTLHPRVVQRNFTYRHLLLHSNADPANHFLHRLPARLDLSSLTYGALWFSFRFRTLDAYGVAMEWLASFHSFSILVTTVLEFLVKSPYKYLN